MTDRHNRRQRMANLFGAGALVAGANGSTTSPPSPPLPRGTSATAWATGKPDSPRSASGWGASVRREHLCLPPQVYPAYCGPGTTWVCGCTAVWLSEGQRIVDEYPVSQGKNDYLLGPLRWRYHGGGHEEKTEVYQRHADELYDWRPMAAYYVKLLRSVVEGVGQDWRPYSD